MDTRRLLLLPLLWPQRFPAWPVLTSDVAGVTNSVVTIVGLVGAIVFRYTASRDIKRGGLLQKD